MAKIETTKAPEGKTLVEQQIEELHKSYQSQIEQIRAVLLGTKITLDKGNPNWTETFVVACELREKYEAAERLNEDLSKKLAARPLVQQSRPDANPEAIILPDGMRINLKCLAAYHPSGDGDIEFKTSDGNRLAFWSAPASSAQGSIDPARRRKIRDEVIENLDELFGATK